MKIYFYRECSTAKIPKRASQSAAGFDLASAYKYNVKGYSSVQVDTGIKVIFPLQWYGRIAGRSGLALKHKLIIGGGTLKNVFFNISTGTTLYFKHKHKLIGTFYIGK